jgi:hypothetical protein
MRKKNEEGGSRWENSSWNENKIYTKKPKQIYKCENEVPVNVSTLWKREL